MKEMLAMQRDLEENQAKELALAANVQNNKMKLLTDLAAEEAKREEAVKKVQQMKEKEKESLMNSLHSGKERQDIGFHVTQTGSCRKKCLCTLFPDISYRVTEKTLVGERRSVDRVLLLLLLVKLHRQGEGGGVGSV